jgi:hypothetical protein
MKEKNVFGQSLCLKQKCPGYHKEGGGFCDARLNFTGKGGMLCKLPIGIELKYVDGR